MQAWNVEIRQIKVFAENGKKCLQSVYNMIIYVLTLSKCHRDRSPRLSVCIHIGGRALGC